MTSSATHCSPPPQAAARIPRHARRDTLLDAASVLLEEAGLPGVTMDAVAAKAAVSRPLVYKHFANREELLVELFERESALLEAEVVEALHGADGVESVIRISVETVVYGVLHRGRIFGPLMRADVLDQRLRDVRRTRNDRNQRWYVDLVQRELAIPEQDAAIAVGVFFNGLDAVIAMWRKAADRSELSRLVDVYVQLVLGGLRSLSKDQATATLH